MSDMQINSVLAQIRALREQAGGAAVNPPAEPQSRVAFSDLLKQGVEHVNETQQAAGEAKRSFELGEGRLLDVMIASQKSRIEFRAAVEVRNRLVSAYQEIMNMPI